MKEKLEIKTCDECGRSFSSEDESDTSCLVCNKVESKQEVVQDYKDILSEDPEVHEYVEKKNKEREDWMMSIIRAKLSWYDRFLFFFYKRLADRFAGGDKVVAMQERENLNDTKFGIKVNGIDYWMEEKEIFPT